MILNLTDIGKDDVEIAGGKGANLGELINHGFPVPSGFVIPVKTYDEFFSTLELPTTQQVLQNPQAGCATIRYKIAATTLGQQLEAELTQHHNQLQKMRNREVIYAVRSSATAEDLGDASFAGQHDTYYYVSLKNLSLMIKKCWASLWSDAAYSYRESQGIKHDEVKMAVIVQEMIHSETSGVTFTADPVSGSESVIITESSWGMGAAIVDGRVSPDQYVVDKNSGKLTSVKIADKKFMVPAALSNEHTSRLIEVPSHLRRTESLNNDQVNTISHWASKSEDYFGAPQDLEWAFESGQFYMLQSRPITTLGEQTDSIPEGKYVLFKPLAENFTDPLLPLTQDILMNIFPMMATIYGRAYLKLSAIRALVPLKASDQQLANLAYLNSDDEFKAKLSIPRLLMLIPILVINHLCFGVLVMRASHLPDGAMDSFRLLEKKVVEDNNISAASTIPTLFFRIRFFEPIGNMVMLLNLIAPRYMFLLAGLKALLNRWLPGIGPEAPSMFSSGNDGILSTEMGREIWALAKTVKLDTDLTRIILDHQSDEALEILSQQNFASEFMAQLKRFIDKHGHRTLKEFELNSVRWEEDPAPIIAMIKNYLLAETDPTASEQKVARQRQDLEDDIKQQLDGLFLEKFLGIRFRILSAIRERLRYFIKLRENSRFYHIMAVNAVRKKILKIEKQLLENGSLKCKDDIFYLHWNEIQKLTAGETDWHDVEDIIRSRRMNHIRLSKMRPPKTVGIKQSDTIVDDSTKPHGLRGQPASPGIYQGFAKVIMDPAANAELKPGEILVAPYTDPAWTPLFLTAHAAVIEVGSYLSHAGTIAREYGMPCVVDVADCTSRITTGDLIEVDGSSGSIHIIRPEG